MGNVSQDIRILYEDNHLLVAVKPPGVLSQADGSSAPDMLTLLKEDLKHRYGKPGNVFLGLVHRLDRPVGGVMVFARTSKAASRLSEQVRTRRIRKEYAAVVSGRPEPEEATLTHHLVKDPKTGTVRVDAGDPSAREAILRYRVLDTNGPLSLVRIGLETGRPHQIRVQMAAGGHPIVNDLRYGGPAEPGGGDIALWAVRLVFSHPVRDEELIFASDPPDHGPWAGFRCSALLRETDI